MCGFSSIHFQKIFFLRSIARESETRCMGRLCYDTQPVEVMFRFVLTT